MKLFNYIALFSLLYSLCNGCPPDWENFQNKKCIKYFPVNKNHQGAIDLCNEEQATLVSIQTYEEQDFIEVMAKKHSKMSGVHWAWIGATRPHEQTNEFIWPNGRFINFTRWRNGCPDSRTGENCVLMTVFKDRPSHWCNFKCDSNHDHVICEKPYTKSSNPVTTVKPVTDNRPCPLGWEKFKKKCYKFHGANVTGDEARHICKYEHNGTMVSIHSEEEMVFLIEFLFYTNGATEAAWIGLKRRSDNSSEFYWINNKPLDFQYWGFNEPDNRHLAGPENCVIINDMKPNYGRWIDVPCHLEFLLICERDAKLGKETDNESTENSVTDSVTSIESGSNAQTSKLQSQVTSVCSHGVWLALLSISTVLLFISLGILYYYYRKKINEGNLYSSTIDFANIRDYDRSVNDYNQDVAVAEPCYTEITYQPSTFSQFKVSTHK